MDYAFYKIESSGGEAWKHKRVRFKFCLGASLVTLLSDTSPSPLIVKHYARRLKDEEKSQKVSVCRAESF